MEAGSDVNQSGQGEGARTPIQAAAEVGIIGSLTALQGAAIQGHMDIVLLLLNAEVDVNADPAKEQGRMALDGAAEHGQLEMVQLLLNSNAESEEYGGAGYDRAMELAKENGHFAVVELLKSHSTGT